MSSSFESATYDKALKKKKKIMLGTTYLHDHENNEIR